MSKNLVSALFETKAIRICKPESPFWYTSNKIGPYYINTHFLYENEDSAKELLTFIDDVKADKDNNTRLIFEKVNEMYSKSSTYSALIDSMVAYIRENTASMDFDLISGGERRDWFFSLMCAKLLGKKHVTIFKDLDFRVYDFQENCYLPNSAVANKKVLHIADIITEASSYVRAWIPAIKNAGGTITSSLVVVDRLQGGAENLKNNGVASHALVNVDKSMFDIALDEKLIDKGQYDMVINFLNDPFSSMQDFLLKNPGFLQDTIDKGGRDAQRASICLEQNLYSL